MLFLLRLLALYGACDCSRILVVFPMVARSHYFLGNALARGLAEAGHDVTVISPFEDKNPIKNGTYRNIVLTGLFEEQASTLDKMNFFDMERSSPFMQIPMMNHIGDSITEKTLNHPNFQGLLRSGEKYDAVIIEQFVDDALKALAYHYSAPLIIFSTIGANRWVNTLVGNPEPSSYVPDIFMSYPARMNFWQRLDNLIFGLVSNINLEYLFYPSQNKLLKKTFPDAPDLSSLLYNTSLVLVNSHESTNQPVPHVPNMIDIGGFHVKPPKKLPKDLQEFIDNAVEGVIYFSLGSNIRAAQMPLGIKNAIVNTLGKLKQKVLWKWDEEDMPNKPANFKISKWFPQQDILAHPNIKLFITHGGLLSTIETIYYGVPVLAFPVFGDQKINAARAELLGYGKSLPFSQITEVKLTKYIKDLIENPKYRENAKYRSTLMHDRPIKPMDLAIYWTEYVIRHKGAPHLQVEAIHLSWYKYFMIDVIAFLGLVFLSTLTLFYILIRKMCFRKHVPGVKDKLS